MMTLIGYSANATAIELKSGGEGEGPQRALLAAVTFFLIAKALRGQDLLALLHSLLISRFVTVIICLHYAYALPDFREAHLCEFPALTASKIS